MIRTKLYMVKKDANQPAYDANWIIMNGYEFARFMETEEGQQRRKRFAKLDGCENNDVDYIIECDEVKARKIDKERKRSNRARADEMKQIILSINSPYENSESLCFEDTIPDLNANVEDIVICKDRNQVLHNAINSLTPMRKELIQQMFFDEHCLGLCEYASKNNIDKSTASKRKRLAFMALKKNLKKFGYVCQQND